MNRKIILLGGNIASARKKYSALSKGEWKIAVESDDNTQFCKKMKARFPGADFIKRGNLLNNLNPGIFKKKEELLKASLQYFKYCGTSRGVI